MHVRRGGSAEVSPKVKPSLLGPDVERELISCCGRRSMAFESDTHRSACDCGAALTRIARVLCPVDLSEPSRHALDHAVAVTAWCEAQLIVLHVFSFSASLPPI